MAFGILFDLRIRHDFWLNVDRVIHDAMPADQQARLSSAAPSSRYLEIFPSHGTKQVMAGHGILFKSTGQGARVGIELEGTTIVPRRPIGAASVLRFGLRLTDPAFVDYSAGLAPRFYAFGNDSGNLRGGEAHLSALIDPHLPTRTYRAGEVRAEYQGALCRLFQARRDTGPSAAPVAADWQRIPTETHDPAATYVLGDIVLSADALFQAAVNGPSGNLNDATQWTALGPLANQYVTGQDQLALRPPVFSVDVQSVGATSLEARVTRPGNPTPVYSNRSSDPLGLDTLPVDLRGLTDGRYRLDILDAAGQVVAGLGEDFYLSATAMSQGWFGVIEIRPGAGAFALLDGGGQLRSPQFELRFLNTSARTRYRFPALQAVGVGAEVAPDPADASILVTPAPRPVTHLGAGVLLRADDPATPAVQERILLPHATTPSLRKQGGEWFSDLHLTNLPPLS